MTFNSKLRPKKDKTEVRLTVFFNSESEAARLLGLSGLGWIITLFGILCGSYLGRNFTEILSFKVADGWCPPNVSAIGQHCFGDFGHPYLKGGMSEVYMKGNLTALNSPLTMFIFEFIRTLNFQIALVLFLFIGAISVISPVWWATKSWPAMVRYVTYFLIGFGSLGFITVFDRANPIIFFPGLILWFVVAMEKDRRTQVILAIAIMSALKYWAPLFALCLIVDRRWRDVFKCSAITLGLYILPLMYFPGNLLSNIQITLNGITSQYYANQFQPYVISISGLIRRVFCGLSSGTTCNTMTTNWGVFGKSLFTTTIALSVAIWAAIQYKRNQKSVVMKYVPIIVLGAIALPTAQPYNSVLLIPAASLILKWHSPFDETGQMKIPKFLVPAILSGIVPLPIWFFGDSLLSSNDGSGPVFRIAYWVIPIMWVCLIFETIWLRHQFTHKLPSRNFRCD